MPPTAVHRPMVESPPNCFNVDPNYSIAGLEYDSSLPFEWETPYNGADEVLADQLWNELGAEVDVGLLALPKEWAASKHLPEAQDFPWDQEKGVYLMNGHHNLHCLVTFRISLMYVWRP